MGNSTNGTGSDARSLGIIQTGCEKSGKWLAGAEFEVAKNHCGSELARDEAGTFNIDVD
jgi:hypothetical protein